VFNLTLHVFGLLIHFQTSIKTQKSNQFWWLCEVCYVNWYFELCMMSREAIYPHRRWAKHIIKFKLISFCWLLLNWLLVIRITSIRWNTSQTLMWGCTSVNSSTRYVYPIIYRITLGPCIFWRCGFLKFLLPVLSSKHLVWNSLYPNLHLTSSVVQSEKSIANNSFQNKSGSTLKILLTKHLGYMVVYNCVGLKF